MCPDKPMFSGIIKRSRRELPIEMAEHRSILENKRAVRILVIIQDRPMFSHIIQKVPETAFDWCGWTSVYLEKKNITLEKGENSFKQVLRFYYVSA